MTLDEAIKHAEEVAEEQDKLCKRYDDASGYTRSHNEDIRTTNAKECVKCAEEHRQLAEWLRDYKRLKEQETCEDAINRQPEIIRCGQCKYAEVADSEDSQDGYTCQFHRGSIWFSGSYCSWAEPHKESENKG